MCIFRAPSPPPVAMPSAPPIKTRSNEIAKSAPLPTKKELVDPDEVKGVEFGSTRKKETPGTVKKGAKALRIPINIGAGTGSGGGTPNV